MGSGVVRSGGRTVGPRARGAARCRLLAGARGAGWGRASFGSGAEPSARGVGFGRCGLFAGARGAGWVGHDRGIDRGDDQIHPAAACEEWTFDWWSGDGSIGGVAGYRLVAPASAWYWFAVVRFGQPLLHVVEFDIPRRADPMIAKSQAMWAEFTCEAPFEQWTLGNETYAVLLDDPAEALGRAYGEAVPIASDLEWYATAGPSAIADGYEQPGVLHGTVELTGGAIELAEVSAHRTHRWSDGPLPPWAPPPAFAHLGLHAPFAFPDGSRVELVLTADGWRTRTPPG